MKHFFLFILLPLCSFLFAQSPIKPVFCGNEIFSDVLRTHYPALQRDIDQTFLAAKNAPSLRSDEPLTIHVVVHVVWNGAEENLHDSIILNQIDVLNYDYNRLNADTVNLRPMFQPYAGNANIHFELEEIVRVETNQLFNVDLLGTNLLTEAKHDVQGGSDAWDTESYLNIWIVKIQPIEILGITIGQILGFAFPPAGLDHWPDGSSAPSADEDGVVLDYRIVGSNNPNTIEIPNVGTNLVIKGRSATHEVGHYLGLRHIWGDGGLLGPNDCQQSDGIDDTPFADAQSSFDCDKNKNSCPQIETHYNENMPDLVENYMDYSSEDCMNMFTHSQTTLMRNVLFGPRQGLLEFVSSVEDEQNETGFSLYPNPSNGDVTLTWNDTHLTDTEITIIDHAGRVVKNLSPSQLEEANHQIKLSTSSMPAGIYQVVIHHDHFISVEKLVIMKD